MELSLGRSHDSFDKAVTAARSSGNGTRPVKRGRLRPAPPRAEQGEVGSSTGINFAPGHDDDGWIVPPPVTLADGTQLQLYKDGEALHAAYSAIEQAKTRVCLEVYIFANDDTGRAFADLLARKSREGVRVFVIYDSFGTRGLYGSEPEMVCKMRRAGVHVRQFHPMRPWECDHTWRFANRDHRKLLLVDNDIAGLGGLNVGVEYSGGWITQAVKHVKKGQPFKALRVIGSGGTRAEQQLEVGGPGVATDGAPTGADSCDAWRDSAVSVRGPGARMFREAFAHTWNYIGRGGPIKRAQTAFNLDGRAGELGVLASVPTMNSPLRPLLCNLMRSAKKSLWMTMAYFVPDDELISELCRAGKRGVNVRLMLPGRSDVPVIQIAARAFYEKLMCHGVQIYERNAVVLHSKTLVIDGCTSVVGSSNLDSRSIEYNCELSAVIRSAEFGKQMQDLFENDVRYATLYSLKEWRKRPHRDRVWQWAVSRCRYLM